MKTTRPSHKLSKADRLFRATLRDDKADLGHRVERPTIELGHSEADHREFVRETMRREMRKAEKERIARMPRCLLCNEILEDWESGLCESCEATDPAVCEDVFFMANEEIAA